jgi:hypothetical protein
MRKQKLYEVLFLIDGYIICRVKATNENEAINKGQCTLDASLESSNKFHKADLSYTDGPFAEEIK